MRIALIDFGGYAFPAQLSRALSARGHQVQHSYCADVSGPKGMLSRRAGDPPDLTFLPVSLQVPFAKYNFVRRRQQEILLGRACARAAAAFRAEIVVVCNGPIDFTAEVRRATAKRGARFVYWLQDIMSVAITSIISRRFAGFGRFVAAFYRWKEARIFRRSDTIIAISPAFFQELVKLRLDPARCHVLPNWAPLDEIPLRPKNNDWARAHGLEGKTVVLYSGTIGLKHNPDLLVNLAEGSSGKRDHVVVAVSEGIGMDYLKKKKADNPGLNLLLLPFQPIAELPNVLASADVLTAFVEPDAGNYSVPSKILSYICAGRPLVLAVPLRNDAAQMVTSHKLGLVCEPDDAAAYTAAVETILDDAALARQLAANARAYAEAAFDINTIAQKFEAVFRETADRPN